MSRMPRPDATLLVVDVQKGLDDTGYWGPRNNKALESNLARLLGFWRRSGWPVVHIQHSSVEAQSPLREGLPGWAFKDEALPRPGEPVYQKNTNSAFIGTTLERDLRRAGASEVVVVGLTTNHCVSSTARMAANLGFATFVVADATATFDRAGPDGILYDARQIHAVSLASLHGEFATVVDTDALLAGRD